jgi:hypothetical protein
MHSSASSSEAAAPVGSLPLVSVVHAEPTPYREATLTTTATTTKPLSYREITSSTATPLTGYTGRYTQPDPLSLRGGVNLFEYANASPTNLLDPDGLKSCKSGLCPDCPGGTWVGTAGVAEGGLAFRLGPVGFEVGALSFTGILLCTSNLSFNVPFTTVCSYASAGPKKPGLKTGASAGLGGAGFGCSGFPCREDLAGEESGFFAQVGPVYVFREGVPGKGGCTGVGAGAGGGVFAGGGFTCRTFIGPSLTVR